MLRGDLNWYKQGWGGSHEFQTGFLAMPRSNYDKNVEYLNDGFIFEEQRQRDPEQSCRRAPCRSHRQYVARRSRAAPVLWPRQRHRRLRAGHVEAGLTHDGHRRRSRRFRASLRRASRPQAAVEHGSRAPRGVLVPADGGCEKRPARHLRQVPPAIDGYPQPGAVVWRQRRAGAAEHVPISTETAPSRPQFVTPPRGDDDFQPAVRSRSSPAEFRRVDARLPAAVPRTDRDGRCRNREGQSRSVRAGRHQRDLPGRPHQALRRVRQGRSEPGPAVSADQQHVEHDALPRASGDGLQEHVAWVPGAVHRAAPVATPEGTWNPTDPATVHPAGRVPQQRA